MTDLDWKHWEQTTTADDLVTEFVQIVRDESTLPKQFDPQGLKKAFARSRAIVIMATYLCGYVGYLKRQRRAVPAGAIAALRDLRACWLPAFQQELAAFGRCECCGRRDEGLSDDEVYYQLERLIGKREFARQMALDWERMEIANVVECLLDGDTVPEPQQQYVPAARQCLEAMHA